MLRLRLRDGIGLGEFRRRFGCDFTEMYGEKLGFFPGAFIDTRYNRVVFTGGDPTKAKAAVGQASGHSSRYVMVKCKGCGATNKILSGTVGECEYCGSRLSAN